MSSLPLDHQVSSVLKDSVVLYALESTGIQDQARVDHCARNTLEINGTCSLLFFFFALAVCSYVEEIFLVILTVEGRASINLSSE